ncbi:MAG: V-type ATP synthase subunit I [Oscillospiraceae bacterium]|nr:V-type ATP synthase subunit I [Oscillospiraceae bacterium]
MIASMKYLSIICMKEDRDKLLTALQKCGEIMLCETEDSTHIEPSAGQNMRRMEKLIKDVKPYKEKKPLFAPNPEVTESEFEGDRTNDLVTAGRMEALLKKISETESAVEKDRQTVAQLTPWQDLTVPVEDIGDTEYTSSVTGSAAVGDLEACREAAEACGAELQTVSSDGVREYMIAVSLKGENLSRLFDAGFERAALPLKGGKVADRIRALNESITENNATLMTMNEELKALSAETDAPELLYEQFRAESEREAAPFTETDATVVIEGWVPEDKVKKVEKTVAKVTDAYDLQTRDPLPDEKPPSQMRNNYLTSQFEGITNMFSVPMYGDNDPNPVMAPWYWIIFGLMMGDAGYGLMMVVLGLILKKLMQPKGTTEKLFNVIIYSSITTMICGVLFGSYFGETWHPILFSPMNDPLKMLILTLIIGVLHIFTGMITKIVYDVKAGRVWDAIFDQVSWIMVITGLGLLFLKQTKTVGMILAIAGALIVLFTAGREKKGIFGKATGGLLGLYGVTGYMSDILSYSRILALSLATGVVGMVMNMLARMIQGNVFGFILSLVIYAFGHVFNLVLGLLSAYVHDCRLQYIEFYSKFYDGNGRLFKPFAIQTKYIDLKDDGGKENG